MVSEVSIPTWDVSVYFPSLESEEFKTARLAMEALVSDAESVFAQSFDAKEAAISGFEAATKSLNQAIEEFQFLSTYVNCFVDTDSKNQVALAIQSELDLVRVRISKLRSRWVRWIGSVPASLFDSDSDLVEGHAFAIKKARTLAAHQLSAAEEDLASDLQLSGSLAWEKLYNTIVSQIEVDTIGGTGTKGIPMSEARNLAYSSQPDVRENAFKAELVAWKEHESQIASCLNGIKGEFLTLNLRRGWNTPLDQSVFNTHIDRKTLDAMLAAAEESFPAFRRYLRAKGKKLGYPDGLPWHSLFAPLASDEIESWTYGRTCRFVEDAFADYSGELAEFARSSFENAWIDALPRPGKADGGYCSHTKNGESRIFMNFEPSFGSVSTLAHELGHAYHNLRLKNRAPLQRQTPMTLAETASIFCETIIRQAGVRSGSEAEKLSILEASLMGNCQVVVDITSRFKFESAAFEARKSREVAPDEFCAMMSQAQESTYGDGLAKGSLHPYMWAAKPHYYDGDYCFYNYPYMFGLLFGLGLYSVYEAEPIGFHQRYDELLSSTGMADAATCAQWFGIDIQGIDFWRGSLKQIERDIDEFVALVG